LQGHVTWICIIDAWENCQTNCIVEVMPSACADGVSKAHSAKWHHLAQSSKMRKNKIKDKKRDEKWESRHPLTLL